MLANIYFDDKIQLCHGDTTENKMEQNSTGRESDKYVLRFPDGLREDIKAIAAQSRRSMNAEFIFLIEQGKRAVYGEKNAAY